MFRRGIVPLFYFVSLIYSIAFSGSVVTTFRYEDLPTEVVLSFGISGSEINYSTEMNRSGNQLKLFIYECSFPTAPDHYEIGIIPVDFVEFYGYASDNKHVLISTIHLSDRTIYEVKVKEISRKRYRLSLSLKKNVKLIDMNFTGNGQSTLALGAKLLAEEMGVNLVVDPHVGNKVIDIKLTNVTFQEALDNLALAADVSYVRLKDGSIYISDPVTIEQKFREEAGDNMIKVYDLSSFYQRGIVLSSLVNVLKDFIGNKGFIQLITGSNMLIVRGSLSTQNAVLSLLSRAEIKCSNAQYRVKHLTLEEAEQVVNITYPGITVKKLSSIGFLLLKGRKSDVSEAVHLLSSLDLPKKSPSRSPTTTQILNKDTSKSSSEDIENKIISLPASISTSVRTILNLFLPSLSTEYIENIGVLAIHGQTDDVKTAIPMIDTLRNLKSAKTFTRERVTSIYPLNSLRYETVNDIIKCLYPDIDVVRIPERNEVLLKGDKADVNRAIPMLNSIDEKPGEKQTFTVSASPDIIDPISSMLTFFYPKAKVKMDSTVGIIGIECKGSDVERMRKDIEDWKSNISVQKGKRPGKIGIVKVYKLNSSNSLSSNLASVISSMYPSAKVSPLSNKLVIMALPSVQVEISQLISTIDKIGLESTNVVNATVTQMKLTYNSGDRIRKSLEMLDIGVKSVYDDKTKTIFFKGTPKRIKIAESIGKKLDVSVPESAVIEKTKPPQPYTEELALSSVSAKAIKDLIDFLYPHVKTFASDKFNMLLIKGSKSEVESAKKDVERWDKQIKVFTRKTTTHDSTSETGWHVEQIDIKMNKRDAGSVKKAITFLYPDVKVETCPSLNMILLRSQDITSLKEAKDTIMRFALSSTNTSVSASTPIISATPTIVPNTLEEGIQMVGNKLSIDVSDASARDVILSVAKRMDKNCVVDTNVTDTITIVVKNITFDSFIDILKDTYDYDVKSVGNTYSIKAKSKNGKIRAVYDIKYNVDALKDVLKFFDVTVYVDKAMNLLVVEGNKRVIEEVNDIVRQLDKRPKQVMIETKILDTDLSNDYNKKVMLSWIKDKNKIQLNPFGNGGDYLFTTNADKFPGNFSVSADLKRILSNSRVLSQPSLTTLNGQEATILLGDKIPYQTRDKDGNIIVNFLSIGIQLQITPYVNSKNEILLNLYTKVSNVSGYSDNVPVESTREARTNVLVNDGSTIVIGGLIKNMETDMVTKVPFFSILPIIGQFFQAHSERMEEHELTILVTAKVVSSK